MKKKINEISEFLKVEKLRNDKRVLVFLVCLLIATGLWFLRAMDKDYTTTVTYPVKYVNEPRNKFLANTPPSRLELKVNAGGFTLLRHKLNLSFSPIVLNLSVITNNVEDKEGVYLINTKNLIRRVSNQVSNEIHISEIHPEYLKIVLDSLHTKSVPVKANLKLEFKPQFNLRNSVLVEPENVSITGPASLIQKISFLETEEKVLQKLETDIEKTLNLIYPENVVVTPEKVNVKIAVEKYTEKEIKIPVVVKNQPENAKIKLFPSEIKLTLLVGLSEFEEITAKDFSAIVEYNPEEPGEELKVILENTPSNITIVRFKPESVEYLIESN